MATIFTNHALQAWDRGRVHTDIRWVFADETNRLARLDEQGVTHIFSAANKDLYCNAVQLDGSITVWKLIAISSNHPTIPDTWQQLSGTGIDTDEKVKISVNDTTAGYLNGKLVADSSLTLTEQNDGSDETLQAKVSDDGIKDNHVDWGTGASQVSAVDVPIADAGGIITATEVEGALQELATVKHDAVTLAGGSAPELTLNVQELNLAAVLTPTEHTAIGDGAPHHARAHTFASATDHTDVNVTPGAGEDGKFVKYDHATTKFILDAVSEFDLTQPFVWNQSTDTLTYYATVVAAITAATSGEFVVIPPGDWDEAITLKNGVYVVELIPGTVQLLRTVTGVQGGYLRIYRIYVTNYATGLTSTHTSGTCIVYADIKVSQNGPATGAQHNGAGGIQKVYGNISTTANNMYDDAIAALCQAGEQIVYGNCYAYSDELSTDQIAAQCTGGTQTIYGYAHARGGGTASGQKVYGAECTGGEQVVYGKCLADRTGGTGSNTSVGARCNGGTQALISGEASAPSGGAATTRYALQQLSGTLEIYAIQYDTTMTSGTITIMDGERVAKVLATVDPGVSDDSWPVGTVWVRTDTDTFWVCVDNTVSSAVWSTGGGEDEKVKADAGDATAGYLDAKVDNATIEVSATDKLQVKAEGIKYAHVYPNTDVSSNPATYSDVETHNGLLELVTAKDSTIVENQECVTSGQLQFELVPNNLAVIGGGAVPVQIFVEVFDDDSINSMRFSETGGTEGGFSEISLRNTGQWEIYGSAIDLDMTDDGLQFGVYSPVEVRRVSLYLSLTGAWFTWTASTRVPPLIREEQSLELIGRLGTTDHDVEFIGLEDGYPAWYNINTDSYAWRCMSKDLRSASARDCTIALLVKVDTANTYIRLNYHDGTATQIKTLALVTQNSSYEVIYTSTSMRFNADFVSINAINRADFTIFGADAEDAIADREFYVVKLGVLDNSTKGLLTWRADETIKPFSVNLEDITALRHWEICPEIPTWVSNTQFTVTDNTANQNFYTPGKVLTFKPSITWYQAVVQSYSTGTVNVVGDAYTSSVAVYRLRTGERIICVPCAGSADGDISAFPTPIPESGRVMAINAGLRTTSTNALIKLWKSGAPSTPLSTFDGAPNSYRLHNTSAGWTVPTNELAGGIVADIYQANDDLEAGQWLFAELDDANGGADLLIAVYYLPKWAIDLLT